MYFDLISDFHTEFNKNRQQRGVWKEGEPLYYPWHEERDSEVLVVAGDTANDIKKVKKIIREAADYYEHVVFVDGNHEHYYHKEHRGDSVERTVMNLHEFASGMDNVVYLNSLFGGNSYQHGDTLFVGCNGWYDFNMVEGVSFKDQKDLWRKQSNDAYFPVYKSGQDPNILAKTDYDYLKEVIWWNSELDHINNVVVVTHTCPIESALVGMGHDWYPMNGAYGNSLMKDIWKNNPNNIISNWCFGHTHSAFDMYANNIRFVANPRGYAGEYNSKFMGIRSISTDDEYGSAFGEIDQT